MLDGHLNKCKECVKTRVKKRYYKEFEKIQSYEKIRALNPKRLKYSVARMREYRKKFPERYKANNIVNNAIRDGKIIKLPCKVCGNKNVHAHHSDYTKPLEVTWLCPKHHKLYKYAYC